MAINPIDYRMRLDNRVGDRLRFNDLCGLVYPYGDRAKYENHRAGAGR